MIGAYRARAVPFNVNHHYNPAEVAQLLDQIGAEAVVYHRRLAPLLAAARVTTDRLLVHVDDGTDDRAAAGQHPVRSRDRGRRRTRHAARHRSPDDLYLVCTGGTTGRPKGVLWRQGDVYVAAMGGAEGATAETIAATAAPPAQVWFAAPPLMHGAAQWTVFAALHNGRTVRAPRRRRAVRRAHDPRDRRTRARVTCSRSSATRTRGRSSTSCGAPLRPLVVATARDRRRTDRAGAQARAARTAARRDDHRRLRRVGDRWHGVRRIDEGRADAGVPPVGRRRGAVGRPHAFPRSRRRRDRMDRARRSGSARLPERSGEDRADVPDRRRTPALGAGRSRHPRADGTIVLLGRDSMVVNSGGEKIFVEEVEDAIRRHPDVLDALVVGRPSDRFGEEVVALVQLVRERP